MKDQDMLRLFTDFQAVEPDGACWILKNANNEDISIQPEKLNITIGDRVILDAYEEFEVQAILDFKHVTALGRDSWVAYSDWSSRRAKANHP
jgi:hypothetical protein